MKETIVHCDICGKTCTYPGLIDFRAFSGEPVTLFLVAKSKERHESVQMDICHNCARKIEKFFTQLWERGEGI